MGLLFGAAQIGGSARPSLYQIWAAVRAVRRHNRRHSSRTVKLYSGTLGLAGGLGGRCRGLGKPGFRGRKVRTPQGSVPDNVRDVGLKVHGRLVPQKRYRLATPPRFFGSGRRATLETQYPSWPGLPGALAGCENSSAGVRVNGAVRAHRPSCKGRGRVTPHGARPNREGSTAKEPGVLGIGPMRQGGSKQLPKPPVGR